MHETGIQLLNFIKQYQDENDRPPTWAEMREFIGSTSNGHVSYWINVLEEAGYIERRGGTRDVFIKRMPAAEAEA